MRVAALIVIAGCGSPATSSIDAVMPDDRIIVEPDAKLAPAFSDDFEAATLDPRWMVLDATNVDAVYQGGQLTLIPHANALWYNGSRGGLVYQFIPGDFTVSTTVHVHKHTTAGPPDQPIELGGLMARAQGGASENYALIVVGFGEQGHLAVEHKSTTDSTSVFDESPYTADAELRLCRNGATIEVGYRAIGAQTWTDFMTWSRPDFPNTLEVGMIAYDGESNPDVAASFDQFTYASGGCP